MRFAFFRLVMTKSTSKTLATMNSNFRTPTMPRLAASYILIILLSGCSIVPLVDQKKINQIKEHGNASIHAGSADASAMSIRRFFVYWVDNPLTFNQPIQHTFEVTPGKRTVKVSTYITNPKFGGYDTLSGGTEFVFIAKPRTSYRVDGEFDEKDTAMVWLFDEDHNQIVSDKKPIHLTTAKTRAQAVMIP